jgi:hypothetical protein
MAAEHPFTLSIELVPKPLWYTSLKHLLIPSVWDAIRKPVYRRCGFRCVRCGASGQTLYCHELWRYDDAWQHAQLTGFEALCTQCHLVHHPGYASISGQTAGLTAHALRVNGCSAEAWGIHERRAWHQWERRTGYRFWTITYGSWGDRLDLVRVAEAGMVRLPSGSYAVTPEARWAPCSPEQMLALYQFGKIGLRHRVIEALLAAGLSGLTELHQLAATDTLQQIPGITAEDAIPIRATVEGARRALQGVPRSERGIQR